MTIYAKYFTKKTLSYIGIVLVLIGLLALFYTNRFFEAGFNSNEDLVEQEIPQAVLFLRAVRAGYFPAWDPYKVCGIPFFEVSFMGPFYPFVLLYFLFSIEKAISLGFLFHLLSAGLGMFFLARKLRFSKLAAFFCASSWMVSGVFQQYSENGALIETVAASYLAWLVYLFITLMDAQASRRRILLYVLALCVGCVIVGGKPEFTVKTLYAFGLFALLTFRKKHNMQNFGIVMVLGVLLGAVIWGPMLVQATQHGFADKLGTIGYAPRDLLNFLFPRALRRGFFGRIGFLLAIAGFFSRRLRFRANFGLIALVSLILMFADRKIFGMQIVNFFPLASQAHYLWMWHMTLIFALIIFSGEGLTRIFQWVSMKKKWVSYCMGIIVVAQLADLYAFNKVMHPPHFDFTVDTYFQQTPLTNFLQKDTSLFRISNDLYDFPAFHIGQSVVQEIPCFEARVRGVNLYRVNGENSLSYLLHDRPRGRMLNVANIKYVITPQQNLPESRFEKKFILTDGRSSFGVYRNKECLPRAFLLEGLAEPEAAALLHVNTDIPIVDIDISDHMWTMLSRYRYVPVMWKPNAYHLSCWSDSGGFVFLSEMFNPGWKVFVDDVPAKIIKPFNFFMGVSVPPGQHTVEFRFKPFYFYFFLFISMITFLGVAGGLIYYMRAGRGSGKKICD